MFFGLSRFGVLLLLAESVSLVFFNKGNVDLLQDRYGQQTRSPLSLVDCEEREVELNAGPWSFER